jgi:dUTP pyrophosphatase
MITDNIIKFAKVRPDAIIPSKRDNDGCFDCYANFAEEEIIISPHAVKLIPTGIASTFSNTYRIGIRERGSNTKGTLIVMAGQIDSNYTGEWFVAIYNGNDIPVAITKAVSEVEKNVNIIKVPYSKAIAQFAVEEVPIIEIQEISYDELKQIPSERGDGCLGSSKK